MQQLKEQIAIAWRRPTARVLITGENGTGKELVGASSTPALGPRDGPSSSRELRGDSRGA